MNLCCFHAFFLFFEAEIHSCINRAFSWSLSQWKRWKTRQKIRLKDPENTCVSLANNKPSREASGKAITGFNARPVSSPCFHALAEHKPCQSFVFCFIWWVLTVQLWERIRECWTSMNSTHPQSLLYTWLGCLFSSFSCMGRARAQSFVNDFPFQETRKSDGKSIDSRHISNRLSSQCSTSEILFVEQRVEKTTKERRNMTVRNQETICNPQRNFPCFLSVFSLEVSWGRELSYVSILISLERLSKMDWNVINLSLKSMMKETLRQ